MSMQESLHNQEIANLDLSKVAALQQKRTLAFVNHFISNTVQFLNAFAKDCETKFMHFERKLERVEAAMVLLEARLSSIPEIQNTSLEQKLTKADEDTIDNSTTEVSLKTISEPAQESSPSAEEVKEEEKTNEVRPEYERFIKMVQVGVPLEAAKLKASLEGLDPNILQQLIKK